MTAQTSIDFDAIPVPLRAPAAKHGSASRLLLKPDEAADVLGIGRSTLYELLAAGHIESVQIGRSRRIPFVALQEYVDRLRDDQRGQSWVG
jgi:excisionase family DNA binding protein